MIARILSEILLWTASDDRFGNACTISLCVLPSSRMASNLSSSSCVHRLRVFGRVLEHETVLDNELVPECKLEYVVNRARPDKIFVTSGDAYDNEPYVTGVRVRALGA